MTRLARWPSLLLLLVLLYWIPGNIPGSDLGSSDDSSASSVLDLVTKTIDPILILVAVAATLLVGRWRGTLRGTSFLVRGGEKWSAMGESDYLAASRSLAAAGRGLLWGACILNSIYVISFYWPAGPTTYGFLGDPVRYNYVKFGALLAITLGALILIPSAQVALELSGRHVSRAARIARALDVVAIMGLFCCILTVLLSIFVFRHAVIGAPGSGQAYVLPSTDGIDLSFVLWSCAVVPSVTLLAFFATYRPAVMPIASDSARGVSGELAGRFARASIASGVLVATLIEFAGLNAIARTGGQGNETLLQSLVGRMLVVTAIGILVGVGVRLWPASVGWCVRPRRVDAA